MKRKTPFEILKKELPLPKQITIDDADGTRLGTNGVYISDIIEIMEKYAEQEVKFFSSNLPVISCYCGDCGKELTMMTYGKYQCNNGGCKSNLR